MDKEQHALRREAVEEQEARLGFSRFDFADAWAVGQALLRLAPAPIALRIVMADRVLFAASLDGTSRDNDLWLDFKLATVRHYGHSTLWLHHHLRARGRSLSDGPAGQLNLIDHGGGFPIRIGTQVVGVIGVSGLPHEEDHALIVSALEEVLGNGA